MKDKDNIEMIQKQFLIKFNNINKNDDEWNNSELKNIYMLTCMKQMDGNIFYQKKILLFIQTIPKKKKVFTNSKEVKPYDLSNENKKKSNYTSEKNKLLSRDISQQIDECIPYKHFFWHMKQLNEEQQLLVYDIL